MCDKTLSLPYPIFFSTKRVSDFRLEHAPVLCLPGTLEANTFNCGYTIMKKRRLNILSIFAALFYNVWNENVAWNILYFNSWLKYL